MDGPGRWLVPLTGVVTLALGAAATAIADEVKTDPFFADFDKAVEQAKKEKKDLLVDFNGSDW